MSDTKPLYISLIITYFKGENFLPRLLHSLVAAYRQLAANTMRVEVICVNDDPEDTSDTWIQLLKTILSVDGITWQIYHNQQNIGVAGSRDEGIRLATGDWVTCIDQDDYVSNDYFTALAQHLTADIDYCLLNGVYEHCQSGSKLPSFYVRPRMTFRRLMRNNYLPSPSFMLVRRSLVITQQIRFYQQGAKLFGSDDWYYTLQVMRHAEAGGYVSEPIIHYCIHANNYSHRAEAMMDSAIEVLKLWPEDSIILRHKKRVLQWQKGWLSAPSKPIYAIRHAMDTILFMLYYLLDVNRWIRLIHKKMIGIKVH